MRILKNVLIAGVAGVLLYSCYPTYDRTIEDYDIVGTAYDENTDFNKLNTFYVNPEVGIIYDTTQDKPEFDKAILDAIIQKTRENLLSYGWTELENPDSNNVPDVFVTTAITTIKVSGTYYYYDPIYYPGYPYYPWYPGYYPGYPWYPGGYPSYYEYTTGTIFLDMIDIARSPINGDQGYVVWNAAINGLVSSSSSNNLARVKSEIDQAFKQSPYLNKN